MKISEWLAHARAQLEQSGCPDPEIDARWMAEDTLGMSRADLKFESDRAIDPDTLEPVPDGEMGEMVLTTLDRDMMPVLRYRTRDLTRIIPGECKCGRTHRRIDRIKGRTDDMFIIKGVNVFPMQVEKVLVQYPGLGSNYLITLDTIDDSDVMTVEVELEGLDTDIYPNMQNMIKDIQAALKSEILLKPQVKLVKKGSLPMSEGKAVRVKDLREGRG